MDRDLLLTLTEAEALALAAMVRQKRRKHERQRAVSTFVPAPGTRHADDIQIRLLTDLEDRLRNLINQEAKP